MQHVNDVPFLFNISYFVMFILINRSKYRVSAVLFVISPKEFLKCHFTIVPKACALQSTFDCGNVSMTDQLTSAQPLLFENGHSA